MFTEKRIAIIGINTDIGKTIASAVLTEAFNADYWKPVQAGYLPQTDTELLQKLISNSKSIIHKEAIVLKIPASPHAAAQAEGIVYDCKNFEFPKTDNLIFIETAGGLLSPMDNKKTVADFIQHYNLSVLLVIKNYLGSINHSLMCIEVLKARGIKCLGLIFNGERNLETENFIKEYSSFNKVFFIPEIKTLSKTSIKEEAIKFLSQINK